MKYKKYFRKTSLKQKGIGESFLEEVSRKKPKVFLEIGVFHGVTARNVCDLLHKLHGSEFKYTGVDLFGDIPLPELIASNSDRSLPMEELPHDNVLKHLHNVLLFPAVASKKFLITIGDRTVNGLVYRDQLIGNKQVPVSDYAATLDQLNAYSGQVFSIGEKPSIAISNPEGSTRMALAEAITNVCGVVHDSIDHLTFSANWMSSTKLPDERGDLMRGVESVVNLADELGIYKN